MKVIDELYCIREERALIKDIKTPMPLYIIKNYTLASAFVVAFLVYALTKITVML